MKIIHKITDFLYTYKKVYIYGLYTSYLLIFIAFTGIVSVSPEYLGNLETFIKYYVCLFLLIRFNPLVSDNIRNKEKNAQFDRKIAFSAGVFLFLSTTLMDIATSYYDNIKNNINGAVQNVMSI
mgnify:CR=1 FL=1